MTEANYKDQVELLLRVLPALKVTTCFAMHGGTAINLFYRNMPRFSVDIDLTYVPIQDRVTSQRHVIDGLELLKKNIEFQCRDLRVDLKAEMWKLLVKSRYTQIKIEVNKVSRGTISIPEFMPLCEYAQEMFDQYVAVRTVPYGQTFGGKICAALDRQHPRDMFDVQYLLNEGLNDDVKKGLILNLLSAPRPLHEVIAPHLQDHKETLTHQFNGMTLEAFSYEQYESVRDALIVAVHELLDEDDKMLLVSFKSGKPEWPSYNFSAFPAVQWKLQNIQRLKEVDPEKHQLQYQFLVSKLEQRPKRQEIE